MVRPFVVLCNPENRRLALLQAALPSPATVVPWIDFESLAKVDVKDCWFRIDSAGENFEVERRMLRLGAGPLTLGEIDALQDDRGRILAPRQQHLGFEAALRQVGAIADARPGWRQLNPVPDVLELFDKRRTSRRYAAAGIPVPEFLDGVTTREDIDAALKARGWPAVFVKMSAGSSASCLGIYDGRSFFTTIEVARTGWYNTLKVQRHVGARMHETVSFLLREGAQVERAVPKAKLQGAFFDLRVLCVAGEPAFTVVRQNKHPITNLHLGGWRGDLEELRKAVPSAAWDAAMDSCRKVAALYRALHVGVDLMFEPGWTGHRVLEANAFGDLLPNLTREGKTVWEWEVAKLDAWAAGARG